MLSLVLETWRLLWSLHCEPIFSVFSKKERKLATISLEDDQLIPQGRIFYHRQTYWVHGLKELMYLGDSLWPFGLVNYKRNQKYYITVMKYLCRYFYNVIYIHLPKKKEKLYSNKDLLIWVWRQSCQSMCFSKKYLLLVAERIVCISKSIYK